LQARVEGAQRGRQVFAFALKTLNFVCGLARLTHDRIHVGCRRRIVIFLQVLHNGPKMGYLFDKLVAQKYRKNVFYIVYVVCVVGLILKTTLYGNNTFVKFCEKSKTFTVHDQALVEIF
jgi:hypothetical protein